MQATKLFFGIAVFFLCLAFNGSFVFGQESKGAKVSRAHGVSGQGNNSFGGKSYAKEEADESVHHALEELKLLTSEVTNKTNVNKNVIIGSAIAQTLLLFVVTALVGYSLKDKKKNDGDVKPPKSGGGEAPASD